MSHQGTRKWVAGAALAVVATGAALPWPAGCSSPRERYRVLSFFFDGVSDPDAPRGRTSEPMAPTPATGVQAAVERPAGSRHKPVELGQCARCHGAAGTESGFADVDPSSGVAEKGRCTSCHSREGEVGARAVVAPPDAWLHGPVANDDCLRCHEAHDSPNRYLLRAARVEGLCLGCHADLPPRTGPMAKLDCTACHDPHQASSAADRFQRGGPGAACVSCHRIGGSDRTWLHGPAANGLCAACHDAHGGDEHHVRRPVRDVCLSCHDRPSVGASAAHPGPAGAAECDSCHDPHAAKLAGEWFLRRR